MCGAQGARRRRRRLTDGILAPVLEAVSQLETDTASPATQKDTAPPMLLRGRFMVSFPIAQDLEALSRRPPKTLMSRAELSTNLGLHRTAKSRVLVSAKKVEIAR